MRANVTVVTYNRLDLTRRCLESLLARTRGEFFCNVVDNASSDGTQEYLREIAASRANVAVHLFERNMGVAVAANYGWAATDAHYYIKLDNDIEVLDDEWLERLLAFMDRNPEAGIAGYRLLDWRHGETPVRLASGDAFISSRCCNGGCAAIPRRVHERLGFWTEDYGKYGFEDLDYSDRVIAQGLLAGYPAGLPESLLHLGFEPESVSENHEEKKQKNVRSNEQGQRLYVLNKFLFSRGIRPVKVERRYLPAIPGETGIKDGAIRFTSNPGYAPIVRLHQEYLPRLSYTGGEDHIEVKFD